MIDFEKINRECNGNVNTYVFNQDMETQKRRERLLRAINKLPQCDLERIYKDYCRESYPQFDKI